MKRKFKSPKEPTIIEWSNDRPKLTRSSEWEEHRLEITQLYQEMGAKGVKSFLAEKAINAT